MRRQAKDPRERLMSQADIQSDGCWLMRVRNSNPYGSFTLSTGRPMVAHRASWIMHNGEIPDGMVVCHKCDRPGCVNPAHLFLATQSDNIHDCIRKGRGNRYKGEQCVASILQEKQVIDIRSLYGKISCKKVGDMYGISHATVNNIWRGTIWRHLGPVPGYKKSLKRLSDKIASEILLTARSTGWSTRKVGRLFNVSDETVRYIIHRDGGTGDIQRLAGRIHNKNTA